MMVSDGFWPIQWIGPRPNSLNMVRFLWDLGWVVKQWLIMISNSGEWFKMVMIPIIWLSVFHIQTNPRWIQTHSDRRPVYQFDILFNGQIPNSNWCLEPLSKASVQSSRGSKNHKHLKPPASWFTINLISHEYHFLVLLTVGYGYYCIASAGYTLIIVGSCWFYPNKPSLINDC